MSNFDAGAVRERAEALLAKAREDDTFAHALRDDPEGVLSAEGFQGDVLDTMVAEIKGDDAVGYQRCPFSCVHTQCWFTNLGG
jgi:hypothetical protein